MTVVTGERSRTEEEPIRVAIVAGYPTARAGLRAVIEQDGGVLLVSDAPSFGFDDDADVLVIDMEGIDASDTPELSDGQPAVLLWEAPPGGEVVRAVDVDMRCPLGNGI